MGTDRLLIGEEAPNFNLLGTDEKNYSLNSFSDKEAMIVVFSCNHCPYVKAYEERIIKIQEDFKNKVQVVAINSNDADSYSEDSFDNMKFRAKEKGFNFPYLRDEDQSAAKAYKATHTPEVFLFDKNRRLVYQGKIDDNWKEIENVKAHYLRDAIEELIDGKPITTPETFSIGCTIKWKNQS
ncbi:MAG: alkyl hydroperoxide reductase [Ignavibacteria bacterium RBG_13_36_8]|nr:MAG: alkyl hydroperoxide reductase [Ignavibacteria bacterium RBG_13_36_8]